MTPPLVDVTVVRSFSHPVERVYDAWLDRDLAARFLFATAEGTLLHAEMDGRRGGTFRFTERRRRPDGTTWDADHVGVIVRAVRPSTIVLSFSAGEAVVTYDAATATTVEITLSPEGEGTRLVLRHRGVPIAHEERAASGWTGIVEGLAGALG